MANLNIRDFIYLDTDRLNSMLAQARKGLLESVAKVVENEGDVSGNAEGSAFIVKGSVHTGFTFRRGKTETTVPHDYIYNLVEQELSDEDMLLRIPKDVKLSEIKTRGYERQLTQTSFVLVTGFVRIYDTEYMRAMATNYDLFAEIARSHSPAVDEVKIDIPRDTTSKARQELQKAQQELKRVQNELREAEQRQVNQMKAIGRAMELLYKDLTVIRIVPVATEPQFSFSGNLKREHLREDILSILYKFGISPVAQWHMLAQIAAIPNAKRPDVNWGISESKVQESISGLFNHFQNDPNLGFSVREPEIAVTPIAIYRE